jgi:hypothetical protein
MRASAVILLVLENFRSGESHHRQKLSEKVANRLDDLLDRALPIVTGNDE